MNTRLNKSVRRGFTLIELLVVILILAVLAALIVPKVMGRTGEAKKGAAKTDLKTLSSAIEAFKLDCGRYPTTEEGTDALITSPGDVQGWKGPYIKGGVVPLDPYQHEYHYEYPGQSGNDDSYTIVYYGSDGAPGGDGDAEDIVENG